MGKEKEKEDVLFLKYRPETWDEFVGNETVVKSVLAGIGSVHTYLLCGQRGCGKTTLARLIAKELGADITFDVHEIDAASMRGVSEARDIRSTVALMPVGGKAKVYILDECHRLTPEAMDTWLKTLEEPPDHCYFILCTTQPDKVVDTIRSRAKAGYYTLSPLPRRDMSRLLKDVIAEEKMKVTGTVLRALLACSEGIPREALGLLQQIRHLDEAEALELLQTVRGEGGSFIALCRLLSKGPAKGLDGQKRWKTAAGLFSDVRDDPESMRRAMLGYFSKVLQTCPYPLLLVEVMEEFAEPVYNTGRAGLWMAICRACFIMGGYTDGKEK